MPGHDEILICPLPRLLAGLHKIKTALDLAEQAREIGLLLRAETRHDLPLFAQQPRDQSFVQRSSFPRHAQGELAAIVLILDPFDELARHQRRDGAANGGFVGARAMRNVLRAACLVAEAKCGQHPPFRDIQPVALLILAGQRGGDLGRQPVQAERHKFEEVEAGACLGSVLPAQGRANFARRRFWQKSLQFELTAERARSLDSCRCDYHSGGSVPWPERAWRSPGSRPPKSSPRPGSAIVATPIRIGPAAAWPNIRSW